MHPEELGIRYVVTTDLKICDSVNKGIDYSRLSDSGEDTKVKDSRKVVSSRFTFVFALSQFSGPNNLGAWNRLIKQ